MSHEARERAFAQVDELLAEYSQWPFARRPGGGQAIGANLAQAINDEVNKAKDRELQLEVCFIALFTVLLKLMCKPLQIVAACLSVFTRLDSLL
jgi:Golgi phosphoprotein 3